MYKTMSAAGMHGTSATSTGSSSQGQTGRPGGDASGTGSTESGSSYTAAVDTSSLSGIEAASERPATNDSGGTTADNLAVSPTTAEQLASSTSVLDSLTPQSQRPRPPADNFTQEHSDNDALYSLPATPGHSAQEQDNPSSSATTANVSNPQEHSDEAATPAQPVNRPLAPAPRPPELAATAPPQSAAESFDALFADFNQTPNVTPGTRPFNVLPPMAPADEAENPQLQSDTHPGNQTPIVAAGVATTAPTGWSIGGLWQGIAGAGQWFLNNAVRPLATAAGATAGTVVGGALAMAYPRPLGGVHVVEIVGSDGVSVHIADDASVSVYQNGVFTGVPASLHPGMVVSVGGIAYQVEGSQASAIVGNTAELGPGSSAIPLEPPTTSTPDSMTVADDTGPIVLPGTPIGHPVTVPPLIYVEGPDLPDTMVLPIHEAESSNTSLPAHQPDPADNVYANSAPGMEGVNTEINEGKQGIHQPGHNDYIPTRSPIYDGINPQELLDGAHSGEYEVVGTSNRGDPVVDFGVPIGVDYFTGDTTQYGTIHSGDNGAHIVPANSDTINWND